MSCLADATETYKQYCQSQPVSPYCGYNGQTYRNIYCARCNGITVTSPGECPEVTSVCDADQCGPHASCVEDFVDCTFEEACGWTLASTSTLFTWTAVTVGSSEENALRTPHPDFDHTLGADGKGAYFLQQSSSASYMSYFSSYAFSAVHSQAGLPCRLSCCCLVACKHRRDSVRRLGRELH